MGRKPVIVVLYAKSGALGHAVIAHNYANLLCEHGYQATAIDVFECEEGRDIRGANKLYFTMLRIAPWVWRYLYAHWSMIPGLRWAKTWLLPRRFRQTRKFLVSHAPQILITTHPIATSIASLLKGSGIIDAYVFAVFSDWHVQPFWLYPHVNKYLVATKQQARDLARCGISSDAIMPVGILVDESYYAVQDRAGSRNRLGIAESDRVLLVMSGGNAWRIKQFMSLVCELKCSITVYVVGVPDVLRHRLQVSVQNKAKNKLRIHILGHIDIRPYFAAADVFLGKPGGLTVAQVLACGIPTVLGFPMPGHEECNLTALSTAPVAILPPGAPAAFLEQLLATAPMWKCEERKQVRRNARLAPAKILTAIADV